MQDKHETLEIFFPEPLGALEKSNIITAGLRYIQCFLNVAYNNQEQLDWCASNGIGVTFRLDEPGRYNPTEKANSYYTQSGRTDIIRKLTEIKVSKPRLRIMAAICGNEPEEEYNLKRGSDNYGNNPEPLWPQGRAWEHQYALGQMRDQLAVIGIATVSPGYSHKRRRPKQAPEPGRQVWARICATEYNKCAAGGAHDYAESYVSPEDENRILWSVGIDCERVQTEIHIDEVSIDSTPDQVTRMVGCFAIYDLLAHNTEENWSGVITKFCLFVGNGRDGETWSHMRMTDPECYRRMSAWFAQP